MIAVKFLKLFLAAFLLLSSWNVAPRAAAAWQDPGDEHWAGGLAVAGFDAPVMKLISDMQGNVYAGGDFTAFGGESVNHIAKWDGSTWSSLGDGLAGPVNALEVDSRGNLYTDVLVIPEDGLPETVVLHWDGSAWSSLEGDLSGVVDTLAEGRDSNIIVTDLVVDSRDQLYVSGYFYLIQTERYVGYVARWDGSTWTLLGSGMNHTVSRLALDGQDNLYAGGEFTIAGGIPANRVAKWGGASWSALGSGLGGEAPTIADLEADESGNLYVTGQFDTAGDLPVQLIAWWDGSTWKDLSPAAGSGVSGGVPIIFDLAVGEGGDLYAGGEFTSFDGVAVNNIARWDGSSWHALSAADGDGVNERVFAITVDRDGRVFVGGFFTSAGGLPANHIARWDGSTWFTWSEGSEGGLNNAVDALIVDPGGLLYAGGYFTSAGAAPANHIAGWDGESWSALDSGLDGSVHTLALDASGNLYAGGEFTNAGGVPAHYIARWDGSAWNALGGGMAAGHNYPQVRALAVDGQGNLYAGGDFTASGGVTANYIAKWDGATWSALGRGLDGQVTDLVVAPNGDLYAAGWFSRAGEVAANGIAHWDGESWSALGSGANSITALAIGRDGFLYASGMFFIPPDSSTFTHYLASWDGSNWSPLGSGVDNFVSALAVDHQGNLYAGGDFTTAGGAPANRIAGWDGESWSALGSGIGAAGDYSSIYTLATDHAGNLYVGGQFTLAGNRPSAYLAKWCAELQDGGCTLALLAGAATPEPTPSMATPTTTPAEPPAASAATPSPEPSPTAVPSPAAVERDGDSRFLIGAGAALTFLLVGLLLFRLRRSKEGQPP